MADVNITTSSDENKTAHRALTSVFADTPSTAAANLTAIQDLLDVGGYIKLAGTNTYEINAALEINSDTYLDLGNCTIKQADGSDDNLMRTSAWNATKINVTSLTYATGTVSAVTATHNLSAGDYVSIIGCTTDGYSGVHLVDTAVDTTHFTFEVVRDLAASAGTITCVKANQNIIIENGTWDYNEANQTTATSTEAFGHILAYVNNLRVRNLTYLDAEKFCFFPFSIKNFVFENLHFETVSDGIHVNGPAVDGVIRNITGTCGDDGIVLMRNEDAVLFAYAALSEGEIRNVTINGVYLASDTSVVSVYVQKDAVYYFGGVEIRDVHGNGGQVVKIGGKTGEVTHIIDNILVDGVVNNADGFNAVRVVADVNILNLTVKNVAQQAGVTSTDMAVLVNGCTVSNFVLDNVTMPDQWAPSATATAISTTTISNIQHMTISNTYFDAGNNSTRFIQLVHVGDTVVMNNTGLQDGAKLLYTTIVSDIDTIIINNMTTNNTLQAVDLFEDCNLIINGWYHYDTSGSALRLSTGSYVLRGAGFVVDGGATNIVYNDTPTVSVFMPDVPLAAADLDNTVAGQIFNNTTTGSGTLVAGLCVSHGGDWFNVHNPALTWSP